MLTYPAIRQFNTHFFGDGGDGLQNAWNIWWVNKSITELFQNPFYTDYLYYPSGTHLWGHTLSIYNGAIAIPLLAFLKLNQAYNLIVILTFILSGLFTMYLSFYLTRSYWGSFWSGYFFSFTGYRFAHLQGHLNLLSTQFIPLFLLSFILFVKKPSYKNSLLMSVSLFFSLTADLFYGFICLLLALTGVFYLLIIKLKKNNIKKTYSYFIDFLKIYKKQIIFLIVTTLLTSAIFVGSFFKNIIHDPLETKSNTTTKYSLDVLSPFIYGGASRFREFTSWHWKKFENIADSSVYPGNLLIVIFFVCFIFRKKISNLNPKETFGIYFWITLFVLFFLLSLGTVIKFNANDFEIIYTPYYILKKIIPVLEISRAPIRYFLVSVLSLSIVFAYFYRYLSNSSCSCKKIIIYLFVIVGIVELLPAKIYTTEADVFPEYLNIVKEDNDFNIVDKVNGKTETLYYQTFHEKKIPSGYISRTPLSASKNKKEFDEYIDLYEDYALKLYYNNKIRFILLKNNKRRKEKLKGEVFRNENVVIIDLRELIVKDN
jgi:hypothetical protein